MFNINNNNHSLQRNIPLDIYLKSSYLNSNDLISTNLTNLNKALQ